MAHARFREVNDRIRAVAESSRPAGTTLFVCECVDEGCRATIELDLDEFEAIRWRERVYLVAPGHESPDVDRVVDDKERFLLVAERASSGAGAAKT
jgi:hypothetical protein